MVRRFLSVTISILAAATLLAQAPTLADFIDRFTADWIRTSPDQAAATRYFPGDEQQAFERQLTPHTAAWAKNRRELARRGLTELARFDPPA